MKKYAAHDFFATCVLCGGGVGGRSERPMELPTNLLARICEKVCNGRMPNQTAMCTRALVGLEGGSAIPGSIVACMNGRAWAL